MQNLTKCVLNSDKSLIQCAFLFFQSTAQILLSVRDTKQTPDYPRYKNIYFLTVYSVTRFNLTCYYLGKLLSNPAILLRVFFYMCEIVFLHCTCFTSSGRRRKVDVSLTPKQREVSAIKCSELTLYCICLFSGQNQICAD